MGVEIVTKEDLEAFRLKLLGDLGKMMKRPDPVLPWLKSYKVRKMRKISGGILQRLRVNGTLPYSRIGKIMYCSSSENLSVIEFL